MNEQDLAFSLDRDLVIRAPRPAVFRFFTDTGRWARWWGEGSTIEPRVGGGVRIVYPGGVSASGVVLELELDRRLVFTYGYDSGTPIAPGGSRVAITLADHPDGTHLALRHDVADEAVRDQHVQGWRYQLAVFANAVANDVHANPGELADRWFAAWSAAEPDLESAFADLAELVGDDVSFRDGFSCVVGLADLVAHVAAARRHMPGIAMTRSGDARHCQGMVLADWIAGPEEQPIARGTNAFELAPDGRIRAVTGFWSRG